MNPDLLILLDWIRQAAASTNSILLDMETPLLSHPEWFPDFIHPNAAGAREIAETTFCLLDSIAEMDGKAEILEFLTLNTSGLQDEDGAFSDWIESKRQKVVSAISRAPAAFGWMKSGNHSGWLNKGVSISSKIELVLAAAWRIQSSKINRSGFIGSW